MAVSSRICMVSTNSQPTRAEYVREAGSVGTLLDPFRYSEIIGHSKAQTWLRVPRILTNLLRMHTS